MITASSITLQRGTKVLLDSTSLTIHPGQKLGLVGQNGCGKSSLFSLLRNELQVDGGELYLPSNWQIASVAQETPALDTPAIDYVIEGDVEYCELQAKLERAEQQGEGEAIALLHGQLDAIGGYQIRARAAELLAGLGFDEPAQASPVHSFSGGWRMRLNLAQALLCRSDLLLLDEPTNHLDLDTVVWLEQWLRRYPGTLVLISHDRDFLDNIVGRIVHIEQATLNDYTGNYSDFEKQRAEKLAQQQALHEKQVRERAHMQKFVDRFRYKASKAKQAQSRLKALEKMTLIGEAHVDSQFSFSFREPDSLPLPLLTMDEVTAGYGDKQILSKLQFNLVPGSRIGLLGRNGAGKSTFIKLLSKDLAPQGGELDINPKAQVGYFAQHQLETLRLDDSPLQHLQRLAPDNTEQELRNYLGSFGFHGDKALDKVAPFSGGEKARLVLALITWQKPNLLLLDEPTNHLDLDMRHALTMALQNFEGAMVVVSHDRALLRATTDEFYLVSDGQLSPFNGDLDDYQRWLSQAQANSAKSASESKTASEAPSRKELKRLEAEHRQTLAPLRKQLNKAEAEMERWQTALEEVEQQLADSSLYEAKNKAQLQESLERQREAKQKLEQAEGQWFELEEEIDALNQQFSAQFAD
ncbi:ABC transporter ATP-binding protein [Aliagarivorans taiwanensis]|uniref:ABC transporter ATP-binding protein n=1 Tax=Aliagarivorans taiwanensis TaxID=561966 RepID=UPI0004258C0E|nr:ABC transporter ATP-binding protein [Aliagarivorans taiwanensis]